MEGLQPSEGIVCMICFLQLLKASSLLMESCVWFVSYNC